MIYVDTSVIVKLYVREERSQDASDWLRAQNRAMPLTPFHELEIINAIKLKQFRKEMTEEEAELVLTRLTEHEKIGVFYRPQFQWADVFSLAIDLSRKHTGSIGSRSLDVLHVASAFSLSVDGFLTFDEKQSKLAVAAGLEVVEIVFDKQIPLN
jgi:predicted nucleic acid-binding protein